MNCKHANQLISCCGLDCEKCDARIATLTNDTTLREKTAALWTKLNGVPITPEMIHCTGCRAEGAKTPFCDKLCPVHHCVKRALIPARTAGRWTTARRWGASPRTARSCWTTCGGCAGTRRCGGISPCCGA